jgi:hypothetical protein
MARPKKRRVRIRIRQKALVQKKDKTRVSLPDTTRYSTMDMQTPRSLTPTFKIKIRRKGS